MKKVCVVTGSRAEYGLLRWTMQEINSSSRLKLQLIVTGMHLASKYGKTIKEISLDGFKVDQKVKMSLNSDSTIGVAKSIESSISGFVKAYKKLKPDLILLLGDRFDIFTAAVASLISRIPIAHLHGGELTEGAYDDAMRHSITKMSHFHFVATKDYRKRVIQLGENPNTVFNVGGFGIENINKLKLIKKKILEKDLGFTFCKKNLIITFHPVTLEKHETSKQIDELLKALLSLKNTGLIFTMPNADTDNSIIFKKIKFFCKKVKNAKYFKSLGQIRYLSCIQYADGVVGNSSSGLLEVPSFKKGTINIGDRQRGRLQASSVINCKPKYILIKRALKYLFSKTFQNKLKKVKNPYGNGNSSKTVVGILEKQNLSNLLKKNFYNLK